MSVLYGPYYRVQSPSQSASVAKLQEKSGKVWGQPARYSALPSVKAFRGPLPAGERGIEFWTTIPPHSGTHPDRVFWYEGDNGVVKERDDFVSIPVVITKNTQV